jgi:lysophospholipase L1-like esterase
MTTDTIRILAFGDSLTEGYCTNARGGLIFHPYTDELQRLLEAEFPSVRIEILNGGVSGELATSMPERLERLLTYEPVAFDLAIFLGGTNDIGRALRNNRELDVVGNETGNAIADAIQTMVGAVHAKGTDAICMTPPEHGAEFLPNFNFGHSPIARSVLRDRLLALAKQSGDDEQRPKCVVFDLGAALPFQSPDKLFCDTLHFNTKGYDLMAAKLFEFAVPLLRQRRSKREVEQANDE